jgi:hypothetical protein
MGQTNLVILDQIAKRFRGSAWELAKFTEQSTKIFKASPQELPALGLTLFRKGQP